MESDSKIQAIKISAAVGALVIAAVVGVYYFSSGKTNEILSTQLWFYDLGDGKLFVRPNSDVAPIEPPSKHERAEGEPGGVLAHVYSCGACSDKSSHFVGYLETFTSEAKKQLAAEGDQMAVKNKNLSLAPPQVRQRLAPIFENGLLVATTDAKEHWVTASSDEGKALIEAAKAKCGAGKVATECKP